MKTPKQCEAMVWTKASSPPSPQRKSWCGYRIEILTPARRAGDSQAAASTRTRGTISRGTGTTGARTMIIDCGVCLTGCEDGVPTKAERKGRRK